MKKAMFIIAMAFTFTACGTGENTNATTTDSTAVDSVAVDSVAVDSAIAK